MSLVGYATEIIANVPKFKAALPAGAADPEIEAFLYNATNLTMLNSTPNQDTLPFK